MRLPTHAELKHKMEAEPFLFPNNIPYWVTNDSVEIDTNEILWLEKSFGGNTVHSKAVSLDKKGVFCRLVFEKEGKVVFDVPEHDNEAIYTKTHENISMMSSSGEGVGYGIPPHLKNI